ncbi:hypothetical protein Lfu02_73240 [Longispora fulva]|uniref:Uncharacterized protein n=1 Tax=Longispora fulva TaxID=619741 RepID=A0A8J7KIG0_9ACTN|nr:hypothetical protein [Longispora fulva]MBG6133911.1 hypothetical protein [Longispora fulva]GIG62952.1 hypothetical protein Lfu02_73240 [Longispora fulva]
MHTVYMFHPDRPDHPVRQVEAASPHEASLIAARWRNTTAVIKNGYTVVVEPTVIPFPLRIRR